MFRILFRSTAILFLVLFSTIFALAQRTPRPSSISLQIHGQVRYASGNRPAEFILVRLDSFRGGMVNETQTDRTGRFMFRGLSPDLYVVVVRVFGYLEMQQQVDLKTQVSDYIQFQLVAENSAGKVGLPPKHGVLNANVPPAARAEFDKGRNALFQSSNVDEGILHLENAVKIYPGYFEALLLLGTAYMDKSDWMKAETNLKRALTLDPKAWAAHFALGELYFRQKNYPLSERSLLTGIKLEPKSVRGHYTLGRLYYEMGNFAKAGPYVGKALQLDPTFARGHLLAGNILLRAHQAQNALVEFEEYLRLEPNGEFSEQARQTVAKIKRALAKS